MITMCILEYRHFRDREGKRIMRNESDRRGRETKKEKEKRRE